MKRKDTEERRAVHIASVVMQAAGLCRYDSPVKCRRMFAEDADCVRCIESWLLKKARKELKDEE